MVTLRAFFDALWKVLSDQFRCHPEQYIAVYVVGGQSLAILVPLEVYDIYYATGDYWRGEDYLFGPGTAYYHCDDKFKFSAGNDKYLGWTLTLYPVADGNLDTDPISAADFPG